jgi:hypothetical protein
MLLLAGACSSTGLVRPGDTDAGTSNGKTCFESSAPNQGCIDCVEMTCAAQLGAFERGCVDLIDCECPGGYYSAGAAPSCTSQAQESSCAGPAQSFSQCEMQSCNGECTTSAGKGISSGGG